jgi:hypothetical protein
MEQMTILLNNLGVMKLNKTSLLLPFTNKKHKKKKNTVNSYFSYWIFLFLMMNLALLKINSVAKTNMPVNVIELFRCDQSCQKRFFDTTQNIQYKLESWTRIVKS